MHCFPVGVQETFLSLTPYTTYFCLVDKEYTLTDHAELIHTCTKRRGTAERNSNTPDAASDHEADPIISKADMTGLWTEQ